MSDQTPSIDGAKAAYAEICKAHDGIASFRAKLLAFLPIASGSGIFILLSKDVSAAISYFPAIGAFGFLVTFGLYLYELRGIHRCNALSRCGKHLEQTLLGESSKIGAFTGEPDAAFGFVGNTWAAFTIYPTVMAGWVYMAASVISTSVAGIAALATVLMLVMFGFITNRRQNAMLEGFD